MFKDGQLAAAGRGNPVTDLDVAGFVQAVATNAGDHAIVVESNGHDLLFEDFGFEKREGLGLFGDVVPGFAAEGSDA